MTFNYYFSLFKKSTNILTEQKYNRCLPNLIQAIDSVAVRKHNKIAVCEEIISLWKIGEFIKC